MGCAIQLPEAWALVYDASVVVIDKKQIEAFAGFLRQSAGVEPFDFCSTSEGIVFPKRHQPGVVDYFFFCTAHQFGFWSLRNGRYDRPMTARIAGVELKGSDYLSRCATRAWLQRNDFFSPPSLGQMTDEAWSAVFSDDQGRNPLPMWEEHLSIIHNYTDWFITRNATPDEILRTSNASDTPLATFLSLAGEVPGYREDRLRKKRMLLAVILENRPERFLRVKDPGAYEPIIDYHLQRSALRTGLVRISGGSLREKLLGRCLVTAEEERTIRDATFEAVRRLVAESGRSVAAIDYFFFMNRRRCPEMSVPECAACPVNGLCAHETHLFQPVLRTTDY